MLMKDICVLFFTFLLFAFESLTKLNQYLFFLSEFDAP